VVASTSKRFGFEHLASGMAVDEQEESGGDQVPGTA